MFTIGPDPNWQQEKLSRLMEALQLAKARREQRKQEQQQKASKQFQMIMAAADKNPQALESDTVRRFVEQNQTHLPGLQEWYDLEMGTLNDPASPRNAYERLLSGADAATKTAQAASLAPIPGPAGLAMNAAGRVAKAAQEADPSLPFDASAAKLSPSARVRAKQYAGQVGADLPLSDSQERERKLPGVFDALLHPERYPPDVVRASRIQLHLDHPEIDPNSKISGDEFIVQNKGLFNADTVRGALGRLGLQFPPTHRDKRPEDKLSGITAILANPEAYPPPVVRYAEAASRKLEREASGRGGTEDGGGSEKGRLTEYQARQSLDDYLGDFYQRFDGVGIRHLTPGQQRQAGALLRSGGDVDSFVLNTLFQGDGALDRIVGWRLRQKDLVEQMKTRGESPKARAARTRIDALLEIRRRRQAGMSLEAARASVYSDLLEGL